MRCFHDAFCNYVFGLLSVCGRVRRHGPLLALLCKVCLLEISPHGMMITATELISFAHMCDC